MLKRLVLPAALLFTTACAEQITEPEGELAAPTGSSTVELASNLLDVIPLPDDFAPEGIATGRGDDFYVGSLRDGSIYKGSLRTGEGFILAPGAPGTLAVGLDLDERTNLLWVANGFGGGGRVYDAGSGAFVADLSLGGIFLNDVIVTRDAAYFTDSFSPNLYRVPLLQNGYPTTQVEVLPLGGDFQFIPGAGVFNANGIEAIPGADPTLLVVNGTTGRLYTVDSQTGEATLVEGVSVPSGDGLLLDGRRTVYVVQNFLNQIAEVRLSPDLATGQVVRDLESEAFRIPTTVAGFGGALYAVNARFDVAPPGFPTSGVQFEVVRVEKR